MSTEKTTPEIFLACVVSYHGPTSTRGSRVKLTLPRFKAFRLTPFDHSFNNSAEIARAFLAQLGVTVTGQSALDAGRDVLLLPWTDANLEILARQFGF